MAAAVTTERKPLAAYRQTFLVSCAISYGTLAAGLACAASDRAGRKAASLCRAAVAGARARVWGSVGAAAWVKAGAGAVVRVAEPYKPSVVVCEVAVVAVALGALLAVGGGHAGAAGEPISFSPSLAASCAVGLGAG